MRVEASSDTLAKAERRKKAAAVRDAVPAAERLLLSGRLCRNVEVGILQPLRTRLGRPLSVCVYSAFRSEADPSPLVRMCWNAGDTVAAPRIDGGSLEWRIVREPGDWHAGQWGIPEPDPARTEPFPADPGPDAVLVPGLAFDPEGGRLGYGGGFYDRMYAVEAARGNGRRICWIGFSFAAQLTDEALPKEKHDLVLDVLATEEKIIWLHGEGT